MNVRLVQVHLHMGHKCNKYSLIDIIKNSSMLMISVSENFLAESEWFLQNKISPFLRQGICS